MTRAALTKLLILVILAFIICLPEFFTLYRVSKVNFLCLSYRPCEQDNPIKEGENGKIGDAEIRRKNMCDPSQTPESEKWEQDCMEEHQSNTTDPELNSSRGGEDPEKSWFMCKTDVNIAELQSNTSSSVLKVHFEVSVELQLRDAETLSLTLYGSSNHSSLHLHSPEEEKEEEEEDDEGQRKAFYCCLPVLPTSESANQSRCLLWLANQTLLTETAKKKLPWKRTQKDEWQCVFRVLWLALLCVVMLTIFTTVFGQIYWKRRSCKNPKVHTVGYDITGQQLNDGEHTEIIIPKGIILHSYGSRPKSGLTPIPEVDAQDEIETLLDGNVDHCYTANHLHHRIHPSTSSLTEEQAW
ncbi:hypothetical protein EPR50_G00016950 [Perca flavescens]|uniref:Uncharacterized protein n=2 Tax=Perca flavescens TaxID=8167 RepID=A0A484DLN2_PERFV|nr:uncharacterized protein LOC114570119 isoform X1 [Perca flavescens]TDH16173.1 hypothetical protein EPR50_G00016950 [Perca flavescens]